MTVKVKDLLKGNIKKKKNLRERMLDYLKKNYDTAFTSKELQNKFESTPSQINTRLSVLKKSGVVGHMSSYWFYKPKVVRRGRGVRNKRKVDNRGRPKKVKK